MCEEILWYLKERKVEYKTRDDNTIWIRVKDVLSERFKDAHCEYDVNQKNKTIEKQISKATNAILSKNRTKTNYNVLREYCLNNGEVSLDSYKIFQQFFDYAYQIQDEVIVKNHLEQTKPKHVYKHKMCNEHENQRASNCRICHPDKYFCKHGCRKDNCPDCNGCEHGRRKTACALCKTGLCVHEIFKWNCNVCQFLLK